MHLCFQVEQLQRELEKKLKALEEDRERIKSQGEAGEEEGVRNS